MEATIKLVDTHGTGGFTLRAAARMAGVSDGAPYHHFTDRDELLATAAEECILGLSDELVRAGKRARGDPRARGLAMGQAYAGYASNFPARFRLMFDRSRLLGRKKRAVSAELIRHAFAEGLTDEGLPADAHLGMLVWSFVHGLSLLGMDRRMALGKTLSPSVRSGLERLLSTPTDARAADARAARHSAPPKSARQPLSADDPPRSGRRPRRPAGEASPARTAQRR